MSPAGVPDVGALQHPPVDHSVFVSDPSTARGDYCPNRVWEFHSVATGLHAEPSDLSPPVCLFAPVLHRPMQSRMSFLKSWIGQQEFETAQKRADVHLSARLIQSGDYRKNEDNLNPRAAESCELWVMGYE